MLRQRAEELAEREAAHAKQLERLKTADEEVTQLRQTAETLRADIEKDRRLWEQLHQQNTQLQESAQAAHNDLGILERSMQDRKQAWRKEEKEWSASASRWSRPRSRCGGAWPSWTRSGPRCSGSWLSASARSRQAENKVMDTLAGA